jgi:hypothetical protein
MPILGWRNLWSRGAMRVSVVPTPEVVYGFAFGDRSGGDLWLQNEPGVILHHKARREGLMLNLGGNATAISMG